MATTRRSFLKLAGGLIAAAVAAPIAAAPAIAQAAPFIPAERLDYVPRQRLVVPPSHTLAEYRSALAEHLDWSWADEIMNTGDIIRIPNYPDHGLGFYGDPPDTRMYNLITGKLEARPPCIIWREADMVSDDAIRLARQFLDSIGGQGILPNIAQPGHLT